MITGRSIAQGLAYGRFESMATDEELITQTVLDYFEGWFDGDSARMERAVHPDLVKRAPGDDASSLGITTAEQMVQMTELGEGKTVAQDRRLEVVVQDVYQDVASVLVRSAPYHEYLHLVRTRDGWRIANALWRPT
jgi:ketosteroid isomerase-like protein